jgi:preprotein translocase SecE subunit
MARDRQRAKQRRRRQAGASTRSRTQRAREIGLDDAGIDESGLGGSTPTPDPLEHASADVDEALLAETGADVEDGRSDDFGGAVYDDELDSERAPDVAEDPPDGVATGVRGAGVVRGHEEAPHRRGLFGRMLGFLAASWAELQRVQWPDRRHVGQGTAVVLGFVIIAGTYLGLLDAVFSPLVRAIL